jgi:hypothetical protein
VRPGDPPSWVSRVDTPPPGPRPRATAALPFGAQPDPVPVRGEAETCDGTPQIPPPIAPASRVGGAMTASRRPIPALCRRCACQARGLDLPLSSRARTPMALSLTYPSLVPGSSARRPPASASS